MTRLSTLTADGAAHAHAPKPGEVLGGKYRIEREIGSGGMGIVYEVTHLVMTKKRFAVKWLLPLPEGYDSEDARIASRRFVREAEIAGGICHPNVVQVFDVTVGDDDCFMVMELLEGESLETRLKREGRLPALEAVRVLIACASGVGAAHAANVIHRDLKPANIFLTQASGGDRSHVKVLDFGISRFTAPESSAQSTVTRAGTLIGTPMYMAPEQLRGFECDARTDVYGLGVTLYEALSGTPAYFAQTHADLVVRILTGDAQALRSREPAISAQLSAIVMRAMHHDPAQRFPDVQAFAEALRAFVDVASKPPPPATAVVEPRHRGAWVMVVVGCVMLLGLGVLALRRGCERPSPAAVVKPAPVGTTDPLDTVSDEVPSGVLPALEGLQPIAAEPQLENAEQDARSNATHTAPTQAAPAATSNAARTATTHAAPAASSNAARTATSNADHHAPTQAPPAATSNAAQAARSNANQTALGNADKTGPTQAPPAATSNAAQATRSNANQTALGNADKTGPTQAPSAATSNAARTAPTQAAPGASARGAARVATPTHTAPPKGNAAVSGKRPDAKSLTPSQQAPAAAEPTDPQRAPKPRPALKSL